jgi:hypothetical protein
MLESGVARWEAPASRPTGLVSQATCAPPTRNAANRLRGTQPDEGELHVRFGELELETGMRWRATCRSQVGALKCHHNEPLPGQAEKPPRQHST